MTNQRWYNFCITFLGCDSQITKEHAFVLKEKSRMIDKRTIRHAVMHPEKRIKTGIEKLVRTSQSILEIMVNR
ncbi:hypothetical protein QFZ31_001485 [Neobacillus niacini]|uniref:hypothetical protein n=1 Tax=Neobacillus driksii TaxID=3035913 RepID=UPI002787292C|nr:hypothetical protein [Neobacillus niacini]MDQ0971607.1 hypothetical protein [Neobacillus niacini]